MTKTSYRICFSLLLTLLCTTSSMAHAAGASATGGRLYLSPSSGVHQVGEPFVVTVLADTASQTVNALEAELSYNPSDFAVESISTDNSILTSWSTTPAYDGSSGLIKFSGWAGKPYVGSDGLLIAVTLRPLRVTQSTISFNSGAMLAAGQGSNIITTMSSGNYAARPVQITPPTPQPAATSTEVAPSTTPVQQTVPQSLAPPPPSSDQAASVISSGVELAPVLVLFFAALTLIAFGIAYVLHRRGVR